MQINRQEKTVELTHGRVDRPLVGVRGEGVDGLLVGRLKGPHVVEEGGGHVGVLHQVEVGAGVEGQQALQVRYQPACKNSTLEKGIKMKMCISGTRGIKCS